MLWPTTEKTGKEETVDVKKYQTMEDCISTQWETRAGRSIVRGDQHCPKMSIGDNGQNDQPPQEPAI